MGVKIPRGYFSKNNKPIIKGEDVLNASCTCGIDCCDGLLKLISYNSVSGDSSNYGTYIVDGELVTEPISEARLAIKALKSIVPTEEEGTFPDATERINDLELGLVQFYYNIDSGGGFGPIPGEYISGNLYVANLESGQGFSGLFGIKLNSSGAGSPDNLSITVTDIVDSNDVNYTIYNSGGPSAITLPYTIIESSFNVAEEGTNSPYVALNYPDWIEITFVYEDLTYKFRINTVV